jgi:L-2-hydroxyglutarate oxidase LhgO
MTWPWWGAGIVGLAVAREFLRRRPGASLIVIDQQDTVGYHQTSHNSGVIHAGVYYRPGSLKARLCAEGARLMYEYCAEHAVPHQRCGQLIVAVRPGELPRLAELEARGRANGVAGLRRIGPAEIAGIEPECRGLAALHSPGTGITDYGAVAAALERELRGLGVRFALGREITAIWRERGQTVLAHPGGCYLAAGAIVSAGLWADRLAVTAEAQQDPRILPFRGAYLRLAGHRPVVRGMVYPVPDPRLPFLGVHVTRHVDGHVLLGPTAMLVGARDAYRVRTIWPRDLASTLGWAGDLGGRRAVLARRAARDAPGRAAPGVHPGLRAVPAGDRVHGHRRQDGRRGPGPGGQLLDDFMISRTPGVTHVRNAPSPAATSSLALAREIVDRHQAPE